jgi:hypothetical protein
LDYESDYTYRLTSGTTAVYIRKYER